MDLIIFGDGDRFLRCGDGEWFDALGLGEGVRLTAGGLVVGEGLLPWPTGV